MINHILFVCLRVCFGVNLSVRHHIAVYLMCMFRGVQLAVFDSCVSMTALCVCAHMPRRRGPMKVCFSAAAPLGDSLSAVVQLLFALATSELYAFTRSTLCHITVQFPKTPV